MRSVTIEKEYNVGDEINVFLCSDIHLEAPDHDRELFLKEMNRAVKENADILIGGDIFDMILPGDRKRYGASRTKYEDTDAVLNEALNEAVDLFKPFAKNIKVILCGNHDDVVIKYHSIDLVALLIYELNKLEGVNIEYLGYSGFIRYRFKYANGAGSMIYDIKASHGSGGNSVVTRGMIDIQRSYTSNEADFHWFGHKHTKLLDLGNVSAKLDQYSNIVSRVRNGGITGAYIKPICQEQTTRNGRPASYNVDYGDKMRAYQSQGGFMLNFDMYAKEKYDLRIIS